MRIVVIGAGITGVSTAYELAQQGHEVTVYERRGSVASEASFANAGLLAPGHLVPRTTATLPWSLLGRWLGGDAQLQPVGMAAVVQLPWLWRWSRAHRARVQLPQRTVLHRLAMLSMARRQELTHRLQLSYEQAAGLTLLLRTPAQTQAAQPMLAVLRDWAVPHQLVDAARCRELEPGLHAGTALHAAIHLPQDGVGNCRQFAHLLKAEAQRLGAHFRFDITVRRLNAGTSPSVLLGNGVTVPCEAIVVCAGVGAQRLLAGVGVKLPLARVHSHSVTAPLRHMDGLHAPGPRAALSDESLQVTITRLGQRVRVASAAALGAAPAQPSPEALRRLYRVLDDWFPGAVLAREAQHWAGNLALLPDGSPVLGASGAAGVWLNLGHGSTGWSLASGAAQVLAETLAGRTPPMDIAGLTAARLR